jgi:septal ring factor EnvC (AmiA/AmiB activator)
MGLARLVAAALAFATAAAAQAPTEPQRQARETETAQRLEAVRVEIQRLTEAQRRLEGERGDATRAMREADQAVDREARALREIDAGLLVQEEELVRLESEKASLEQSLHKQRDALAQLLRSAYALGRHEQLKLLLAQDRVDELARVLAYHRYFQRDRSGRIEALLGELRDLAELGKAVVAQRETLATTRSAQEQRIAELEAQRGERRALLGRLDLQFRDAQARLTALGRDERALVKLLASLRDVFADIPKQLDQSRPFAQRRGAVQLPLQGRVIGAIGASLPDGRRSQGWLFGAEAGTRVAAVAPGRVAFADWLKGYGLILILDHGDGYMSLYAHNDSLLREAGEWIGAGDALTVVGTSGGQKDAALYFELRRNGQPLDPKAWFAPR